MMSIPQLLLSVAARIRRGGFRALRVSIDTAADLEILAGLDWSSVPASGSDFVHGLLINSRPSINDSANLYFGGDLERSRWVTSLCQKMDRSAMLAELAVLCALTFWSGSFDGTRDGAKAIWAFVASNEDLATVFSRLAQPAANDIIRLQRLAGEFSADLKRFW